MRGRGPGPAHSTLMTENSDDSTSLHLSQQSAQQLAHRESALCMAKYSKRKGEMAELVFALKAISMGFSVSKPFGDSDPYDLVVESHGRLLRIQVKSVFTTNRWDRASPWLATVCIALGSYIRRRRSISWLLTWWFTMSGTFCRWKKLPMSTTFGCIRAGTKRRDGGRYEKYREAWDQLRLGAPALAL